MNYSFYTPQEQISQERKKEIADFLFTHLDQFGDEHDAIMRCINFALDDKTKFGGYILTAEEGDEMAGAVIVNKTGMAGYIPENILVYIAVHKNYRGKGLGKELMLKAIDKAQGSVKLHVEPDNPARYLYEKLGFTSKYLEMRLNR
jgi:[ribosomal protein S18]-alanine N-acetyltransferase